VPIARQGSLRSATELSVAEQATLARALCDARVLRHAVTRPNIIETHISFLVLTGAFVYKIKKAVDLGFLNFTTLESRRHFCLEELKLNRRTAGELYLDVVPIGGTIHRPGIGIEPIFDYAVKMREFVQDALATNLLAADKLTSGDFRILAEAVASFHLRAKRAGPDTEFGQPAVILAPVLQNFAQLREMLDAAGGDQSELEWIEAWTRRQFSELQGALAFRKRNGYVRECHGDLHLGNIVRLHGGLTPFDCIEFNPELRWIDVINDVAFLLMELDYRERRDFAAQFLNQYLEITGDYEGLKLLVFYKVYRALVRAKIALLSSGPNPREAAQRAALQADYAAHIRLAQRYTHRGAGALIITHGLSGSGKTTFSQSILDLISAIRVRSDIERKRLRGMRRLMRSHSAIGRGLYTKSVTDDTYQRLADLAQSILSNGYAVIVDATFLERRHRDIFRSLAERFRVPFAIVDFKASVEELRHRLRDRERDRREASEANEAVLEHQLRIAEPLEMEELRDVIPFDAQDANKRSNVERWRPLISRLGLIQ
jgi:uncharacterized protein